MTAAPALVTGPDKMEQFAAIDLGSNSFHLVVARAEEHALSVIDREREMVRLSAGLDEWPIGDQALKQQRLGRGQDLGWDCVRPNTLHLYDCLVDLKHARAGSLPEPCVLLVNKRANIRE